MHSIPLGPSEKIPFVQKHKEGAICAILREKTPFLAFPEAKKGVVNCARLRKAAHWPNNNANPLGLSEKKSLLCRRARYVRSLGKQTSFFAFPEDKKGVVNCARLRKAVHWPNNNANPLGLSEKKVYCVESLQFCR